MPSEIFKLQEKTALNCWIKHSRFCLRSLILALLVLHTSPSYAYKFNEMFCSINGNVRALYIELEDQETPLPCVVVENKSINTPESATSLWHAGDDAAFCKTKLVGYIEKLRGLGFECWQSEDTDITRESVTSNSTD